jgi:uncharacterized membrane protein YadS
MKPYSRTDIYAGRVIVVVALVAAAAQKLDFQRKFATVVALIAIFVLVVILGRRLRSQKDEWYTGW